MRSPPSKREKPFRIARRTCIRRCCLILFFCYLASACSTLNTTEGKDRKIATINLFAICENQNARPSATVRIPWSETVQLEFNYAIYPEALQQEWRTWSWNGTTIYFNNEAYPTDLLREGWITFDGQKVVVNEQIPSLVKEKIPIGLPRNAQIGKLSLSGCQDFLLKTDFGPMRTIECENIGLIAKDHYSRIGRVYYPQQRLVATHAVKWNHPKFGDLVKTPPYHKNIVALLHELSSIDFQSNCKIDFSDILETNTTN